MSEHAFRILLECRGNVPCSVMFYPRSIEEDWNEEAWIRYRCTWCDHHLGARNRRRRDDDRTKCSDNVSKLLHSSPPQLIEDRSSDRSERSLGIQRDF